MPTQPVTEDQLRNIIPRWGEAWESLPAYYAPIVGASIKAFYADNGGERGATITVPGLVAQIVIIFDCEGGHNWSRINRVARATKLKTVLACMHDDKVFCAQVRAAVNLGTVDWQSYWKMCPRKKR